VTINSYFEGGLTQIPISQPSGPSGTAAASGVNSAPSGSGASAAGTFDVSHFEGGYAETGIYAPITIARTSWTHDGQYYGLFAAPLVKGGFLGFGGNNNIYQFWGAGLRLGQIDIPLHSDKNVATEMWWVDATSGDWANFKNAAGKTSPRYDLKARFRIPATNFFVGYEVNTGPGSKDMRFLFGVKVDPTTVISKLVPGIK
jgi:hypothetical protein